MIKDDDNFESYIFSNLDAAIHPDEKKELLALAQDEIKICTGCGAMNYELSELGACCPDSRYRTIGQLATELYEIKNRIHRDNRIIRNILHEQNMEI